MSRIPTPASIADAPEASRPLLEAVHKQLGSVPNLFRLVANSPAGLAGYLGLNGALAGGRLPAATRERIAIAVQETIQKRQTDRYGTSANYAAQNATPIHTCHGSLPTFQDLGQFYTPPIASDATEMRS